MLVRFGVVQFLFANIPLSLRIVLYDRRTGSNAICEQSGHEPAVQSQPQTEKKRRKEAGSPDQFILCHCSPVESQLAIAGEAEQAIPI